MGKIEMLAIKVQTRVAEMMVEIPVKVTLQTSPNQVNGYSLENKVTKNLTLATTLLNTNNFQKHKRHKNE